MATIDQITQQEEIKKKQALPMTRSSKLGFGVRFRAMIVLAIQ